MPRVKTSNKLQSTCESKINKWAKAIDLDENILQQFKSLCLEESKNIKECAEKNIIESYILNANKLLKQYDIIDDNFWKLLKEQSRLKLSSENSKLTKDQNTIDIYFNEVKREYIKHPQNEQDELIFCDENRDIFIRNNLKLVVNCAKRYRNLGVPFEDLIQAGNYGLCLAFDKFDQDRANLQISIINDINNHESQNFTKEEADYIIRKNYLYSKNLQEILDKISENGFESKDEFKCWVKKNVKKAIFASVAFQWIRAYIMIELRKHNKVIKYATTKEQEDDYVDDENDNKNTLQIVYLDSINNYTNDCYHDGQTAEITNENFLIEEKEFERNSSLENSREIINKLLNTLSGTEKRIIKKRFGIGYPYQCTPSEIAYNEGINITKVKNIIQSGLKNLANAIPDNKRDMLCELIYD